MIAEINTSLGPAVNSPYGLILLADLLEADTDRGDLRWRHRPIGLFFDRRAHSTWNARFAGTEALATRHSAGYKQGAMFGSKVLAHRVLFAMHHGHWPYKNVDHINGDRADNRARNFRDVSKSDNQKNAAMPKTNTSGVIGVSWSKGDRKWRAEITADGRTIRLGMFHDLESATLARKAAEEKLGFHPNHGRRAMRLERAHL